MQTTYTVTRSVTHHNRKGEATDTTTKSDTYATRGEAVKAVEWLEYLNENRLPGYGYFDITITEVNA